MIEKERKYRLFFVPNVVCVKKKNQNQNGGKRRTPNEKEATDKSTLW